MNQKQRTKLELIRIEGICKMLFDKIPSEELEPGLPPTPNEATAETLKKA